MEPVQKIGKLHTDLALRLGRALSDNINEGIEESRELRLETDRNGAI